MAASTAGVLITAIRAAHNTRDDVPVGGLRSNKPQVEMLNLREIEILRWVARGRSNREIAHQIGLAESTVNNCVRKILLKLDVVDRTHAVAQAMRQGFIDVRH